MFSFAIFGDDLKEEKALLIETIKSNYDSWVVEQQQDLPNQSAENWTNDKESETLSIRNPVQKSRAEHIFSDFTFKICDSQAVVQFQVDYQMISAFMEKKNGQWRLVCAAPIPPEI